jgi:apolipoprotein N-acyltransferase
LADIVPIDDFTAGREYTLFPVSARTGQIVAERKSFAILICFEDTVAELSREFVNRGAHLLVNITNDAWFKDTKAPFLHLQASVFRTVENRRSLIRAANTGVSGYIDPAGRIAGLVKDAGGKVTYVSGYAITAPPLASTRTFYTKCGDIFTYLCFGCILLGIIRKVQADELKKEKN